MSATARVLLATAAGLLASAGSLSAQQPSSSQPDTAEITPAVIDAGRAIFHGKGTCFACHGPKLEGTQVAPTLIKTVWKDAKGGDIAAIYRIVTHGVPGTVMVAFPGGVTPSEAVKVVSYIWSVNHKGVKP